MLPQRRHQQRTLSQCDEIDFQHVLWPETHERCCSLIEANCSFLQEHDTQSKSYHNISTHGITLCPKHKNLRTPPLHQTVVFLCKTAGSPDYFNNIYLALKHSFQQASTLS